MTTKTNADYVIKKLKKINFPILRTPISVGQVNRIQSEINEIELSLNVFKNQTKKLLNKHQAQQL